jgi:Flp pilus assembly protein TadD
MTFSVLIFWRMASFFMANGECGRGGRAGETNFLAPGEQRTLPLPAVARALAPAGRGIRPGTETEVALGSKCARRVNAGVITMVGLKTKFLERAWMSLGRTGWLAGTSFLTLLIFFCPRFNIFAAWAAGRGLTACVEVRRGAAVLGQLADPFAPIADSLHRILQWRLLFPLVGHALHLPGWLLLSLPYLGAWLALAMIIHVAGREGVGRWPTWCGAVVIGAGGWFFVSTGWLGYFDSWLVLGLLLTSHGRSRWGVWLSCLLGPWVDERFFIGLPLALLIRWVGVRGAGSPHDPGCAANVRVTKIAAGLGAACLCLRVWLELRGAATGAVAYLGEQQTLEIGVGRHALGLWESLRFGWVFVVAGGVFLGRAGGRNYRFFVVGLCSATAMTSLVVANDLSRSEVVLVPLALEGFLGLARIGQRSWWLAVPLALGALIVPAQHVVTDFSMPISTLPAVWWEWTNPPKELAAIQWLHFRPASAETHKHFADELSKIPGTTDWVLQHYAEALSINPSYAEAHFDFAVELAKIPLRRPEAIAHYREALRLKPTDAEAHYGLAMELARDAGEPADIVAHFEAALRLRPKFAEAHNDLGAYLLKFSGDRADAVAHFEKALELQPQNAAIHFNLGSALMGRRDRREEAIRQLTMAVELRPDFAEAHNDLAVLLAADGKIEQAREHLETALRAAPDFKEARDNLEKIARRKP